MHLKNDKGVTLVETMIAVTILSIVVLGIMAMYNSASKGSVFMGIRTTAAILAKDKIESMMGETYARVMATPAAAIINPNDASNPYPPETFTINKRNFTRYITVYKMDERPDGTLVELAEDAENGLKKIKVEIKWTEPGNSSQKSLVMENLMRDPNRNFLNGELSGIVKYNPASPASLQGANVYIVENANWSATSDANGYYSISVLTGTYNVTATKKGFQDQTKNKQVTSTSDTLDFLLNNLGVGTIQGTVYVTTSPVVVAKGATVTCDDENSTLTKSNSSGFYQLTQVATGYWRIKASSMSVGLEGYSTNVHVTVGGTTTSNVVLSSATVANGSVSGRVTCVGLPVNGIKVVAENTSKTAYTNLSGEYLIPNIATSSTTVKANPDDPANHNYTTESCEAYVSAGQNTPNIDIVLLPAGDVKGTVKIGSNNLPGIIIVATDKNHIEQSTAMSGSDGSFVLNRIPFGTDFNNYSLSPVLLPKDTSNPAKRTVAVVQGVLTTKDTGGANIQFTITPSMGNIIGAVTSNGKPITTGVLVIASTSTITNPPPTIDDTFRSGHTIFYGTVSDTQGNYSISVYTKNTYKMAAWYSTVNGETVSTSRKDIAGVVVSSSTVNIRKDFAW